uniref:Uncharacterized protein n=1 Tax=Rhizophora mucronata TaxID=61149 RepID=A0A2P2ILR2_RHIMU
MRNPSSGFSLHLEVRKLWESGSCLP